MERESARYYMALKEKETFQHISRIERHKNLFNLALTVDRCEWYKSS